MEARTAVTGPDLNQLPEVIRRIVEVAQPERIILFGSAARGEIGPHSDFDLLVIVDDGAHRRDLTKQIYLHLSGVGCPVDAVVVTTDDVRRYGTCPALIIEPALREGREVYPARSYGFVNRPSLYRSELARRAGATAPLRAAFRVAWLS